MGLAQTYGPLGLGLANERGPVLAKKDWPFGEKRLDLKEVPLAGLIWFGYIPNGAQLSLCSMLRTSAHSASLRVHKCTCSSLRSYYSALLSLRSNVAAQSSLRSSLAYLFTTFIRCASALRAARTFAALIYLLVAALLFHHSLRSLYIDRVAALHLLLFVRCAHY
jgi:hypothetical protein